MAEPDGNKDPVIYTLREVAKHTAEDSLWISIHNKVYDVTEFKKSHPGGDEILETVGGQVATEAFENIGHSEDARELMDDCYIGDLHPDDRIEPGKSDGWWWAKWMLPIIFGFLAAAFFRFYTQ